ncbi:MAG: DUF418 domain-containing protein [Hydrogenibacillus schlegelii]|uniref:DUF418 domain-containing protein n=1 Tax=Hydrogenibacillus schlegelii TaxID=1484 RepID=A0A947D186_HYDSH|nr:DUF418 domain-containing protein [Hydrogenibacillus schlegelii]
MRWAVWRSFCSNGFRLEAYGVRLLGTSLETIRQAEDRGAFKALMTAIGEPVLPSTTVTDVDEALKAAAAIGYPVIVRPAYTLGGSGGGHAETPELPLVLGSEWLALVQVLPFMLLGLAFGKLGVAERPAAHRALLNRGLRWALVVWLPLFALLLWRRLGVSAVGPTDEDWALVLLTGWAMSFVYGLVFFRWVPPALPAWTAPIVAVGRMAFTNYILQTVLAVGLMRLFRLYGATTLAEELLAAGAIYGVNVAVSRFWLRRYRFGPLEWLWRMGTYGRWISLRR